MRRLRVAVSLAVVLSATGNASAQHPTRADEARSARDAKAQVAEPPAPGAVERLFNTLEQRALLQNLLTPTDGFGLRVGGIDEGGGLALGPSWRLSSLAGGHVQLHASAAMSLRRDREVTFGVRLPHLAHDRVQVSLTATGTHLAREGFFGLGNTSQLGDRRTYALGRDAVEASLVFNATRTVSFDASAGVLETRLRNSEWFDVHGSRLRFVRSSIGGTLDWRDQPGNPRRGGRYRIALHRFDAGRTARASFNRLDMDLEQHVPFWKKQRMVTLRAITSFSDADEGHDVPFYLQRTLGGSRLLRGFVHDRFRDRNLVVLQGEYAWDVSPFINAVLFYETGMVGRKARDLSLGRMRRDYGFGFRFGSARSVALRTDVAFGSGEGTRFIMRFNHAF
jgi:outer membrane protein assembly factor BamA